MVAYSNRARAVIAKCLYWLDQYCYRTFHLRAVLRFTQSVQPALRSTSQQFVPKRLILKLNWNKALTGCRGLGERLFVGTTK